MRALWLALFLAAAGCSRTALFDSLGPGPVATGGSGAGGSAGTGGGPPCTLWDFLPSKPVALTDPIGDSMLTSLVRDGNHVSVGTMNDNDPSPDPTWRVRVIADDLSDIGTSQVAMQHPVSTLWWMSGIGIAIGSGHRGAVTSDDPQGCRFVELGANGAPTASPRTIGKGLCYWPVATPSGFVVFSSPAGTFAPLTLLALNKHGKVVQTHPDIITTGSPNQTDPKGVARFNDGTLLVAWSDGVAKVIGQHIDAHGNALAPQVGMSISGQSQRFALVSMGGSALIVEGGTGAITAESFDEDGQHNAPPSTFANPKASVGRLALGRARGAALAAWSEGQSGAYHALRVQPLRPDGSRLGAPIVASTLPFIGNIRVIGTPTGALVVFEAENNAPTQVFAVRLVCR